MKRTDAWFKNQLVRVGEALAEADKKHTPEEIARAMAELSVSPSCPQEQLFMSEIQEAAA